MVKRFSVIWGDDFDESDDGDYVCYEDYAILEEALKTIASGLGGDLLGTTSLCREDMQSIARAALGRD